VHDPPANLLEAAVVRLGRDGASGFSLRKAAADAAAASPDELGEAATRLAPRALEALAAAAPGDERLRRLHGVWRPWLERRSGLRAAPGSEREALRERVEERLARIVAAMEAAYEAGDDERGQLLHARYIELGLTHASRLVEDPPDAAR
jgi:hypothetical protein